MRRSAGVCFARFRSFQGVLFLFFWGNVSKRVADYVMVAEGRFGFRFGVCFLFFFPGGSGTAAAPAARVPGIALKAERKEEVWNLAAVWVAVVCFGETIVLGNHSSNSRSISNNSGISSSGNGSASNFLFFGQSLQR